MGLASRLISLAVKAGERAAGEEAPLAVRVAKRAAPAPAPRPVVKMLPAPPKRLALPAPREANSRTLAVKKPGGQWYGNFRVRDGGDLRDSWRVQKVDHPTKPFHVRNDQSETLNYYPTEDAAHEGIRSYRARSGRNYSPEQAARDVFSPGSDRHPLYDWWNKALPKYLKNDFGTEQDPVGQLFDQGLGHLPDVNATGWRQGASDALNHMDTVGDIMFPRNELGGMPGAGDDLRGQVMSKMPWLAKQPVHEPVYGFSPGALHGLGFDHVSDELANAMDPAQGLPNDLAVRPEMLQRMSFPQAVERVGRINQWRAKQMEQASLAAMDNPAIQLHKEYPGDPSGMKWVELRQPEGESFTDDYVQQVIGDGEADGRGVDPEQLARVRAGRAQQHLQEALKHEGDTMGHCVGGYCDDVASGRSRIFSLRDAKGQPHVTVETSPARIERTAPADNTAPMAEQFFAARAENPDLDMVDWIAANDPGARKVEDILQIKGKQNRAPNDEYLPYVQDFVKSGQWGNVGDLRNTGLTKLPDGRYITGDQWDQGMLAALRQGNPNSTDEQLQNLLWSHRPNAGATFSDEDWKTILPHFDGFAYGGRVEAHRDFARDPLAVPMRRAA